MSSPLLWLTGANALNVYLAAHCTPTLQELNSALNPPRRRPLRFYFLTLWAYASVAATLVSILLPVLARYLRIADASSINRVALALAILTELIWLFYALLVLSWRLSGFLYQQALSGVRWVKQRAHSAAVARFPRAFGREEA